MMFFRAILHPLNIIRKQGYQSRPAGLMVGAEAPACIAVEKLVEQDIVFKVRIVVVFRVAAKYGTFAFVIFQKQAFQPFA